MENRFVALFDYFGSFTIKKMVEQAYMKFDCYCFFIKFSFLLLGKRFGEAASRLL